MSRRLDLSMFKGDDSDEEDGLVPRKKLELTDLKSRTFTHGRNIKSRKEIEKEAEEKKRIEEEKAAALVLAEYSNAFEGPDTGGPSSGYGRPGRGGFGGGFVRAGGAPLVPSPQQAPYGAQRQPGGASPRGPSSSNFARQPPRPLFKEPSPPPSAGPKAKGKRAMDSFLAEIKGNQAAREERFSKMAKMEGSSVTALAAWEVGGGGKSFTAEESTNLFVGSLPPNITEESLGMFFAKIGPVATVKIMWPRGDEDPSIGGTLTTARKFKAGLQGFVAFMKRKDAETAVRELDGLDWGGSVIRVGWSKPVPLPHQPLYQLAGTSTKNDRSGEPSKRRGRSRSRSRSYTISPSPERSGRKYGSTRNRRNDSRSRSRSPPRTGGRRSLSSSSRSASRSISGSPLPKKPTAREKWFAKIPAEEEKLIKAVAAKVRQHGKGFEDVLKEREKDNVKFSFMFKEELPGYHLYRSTLSSRYRIPTPPPEAFEDEGYASTYSSDSAEESERERTTKGKIGKLTRKRFEAMLRVMSGKRSEIARAMEYAMNRAEAADEVADVICQSLRLDSTPVPRKMARLHLVSDILHNAASPLPNVWRYRLAFEQRLPSVFAHLSGVYNSLKAYSGNISADVFKSQVLVVLDIWDRWIVFTQEVLDSLRDLFEGKETLGDDGKVQKPEQTAQQVAAAREERDAAAATGFKKSGFKSSFKPLNASADKVEDLDGEAMEEKKEDLDGEDMDLDGEDMDLDGEEMGDDDLDGEAM